MSHLSPEAQELLRAVKEAYRPQDVDRARVLEALRTRVGDAVLTGEGILRSGMGPRRFWSPASGLATLGLAVVGGGVLWLALRTEPGTSPALPSAVSSVAQTATLPSSLAPPASVPREPVQEGAAPPASQASPVRAVPSRRLRDGLSEEVAILSRAETELHAGRPESALEALDEHERRFGRGLLAEERTAARIQALCRLGRTAEAETELARLARIAPHSPHTERARQACRQGQHVHR